MRKILFWSVLVIFLLLAWTMRQVPDGKVHLIFCDVGQGDAALIIQGDFQVLIDTGPKNGGVVACLSRHLPFWDRQLEVLLNSHPELDHLGDLAAVAGRYRIERLMVDGKTPRANLAGEVKKLVEGGTKLMVAGRGDRLRYGDLYFDVLWPEEKQTELLAYLGGQNQAVLGSATSLNQFSLVTLLTYGKNTALFTGDISALEETALAEAGLSPVTVLKVAHHGSKYSSAAEFLAPLSPRLAAISVGKNNYGHPTAEVLERLAAVGAQIWRTDKQGELEIVW